MRNVFGFRDWTLCTSATGRGWLRRMLSQLFLSGEKGGGKGSRVCFDDREAGLVFGLWLEGGGWDVGLQTGRVFCYAWQLRSLYICVRVSLFLVSGWTTRAGVRGRDCHSSNDCGSPRLKILLTQVRGTLHLTNDDP